MLAMSLRTSQEAGVEPGVGAVTPALFSIAATAVDAGGVLRPVVPTGSGNTMMDALHGRRHPEGVGWYDRGADRPICLPIQPTERGQETCHLAPGDERLRRAFVPGRKPRIRCLLNTATAKKRDLAIPVSLPPLVSADPDTLIMELVMDAWMPLDARRWVGVGYGYRSRLLANVMPLCSWLIGLSRHRLTVSAQVRRIVSDSE